MEMNYSEIFNKLDVHGQGYLCTKQIKEFCEQCFFCTLDSQQVEEAIVRVCGHRHCTIEHLRDVISNVMKVFKLEKSIRWEFKFLDTEGAGRISLSDALFLFKSVQSSGFSLARWQLFLSQRSNSMHDYVTCDELVQELCDHSNSHAGDTIMATSFDDYMSSKIELNRMALERKHAVYNDLQKLVAEISDDDDDDFLEDAADTSGKVSLIDRAAERLQSIKKNGLNAFNFNPPKDFNEDLLHENYETSPTDAAATTTNTTIHEADDDDESNLAVNIVPEEQCEVARKDTLKRIINTLVLTKYKCLAEKLLADLVICNHADVPRPESLQNDYSQLLSQLPNDLRQLEGFSVDEKWTNSLEKLFTQCDTHIYCLALIETDRELLDIFNSKLKCTEKFAKLVKWLGRDCSQELIAVEKSMPQDCEIALVHKTLMQFCYIKNAIHWEANFTSALIMSKLLQLSFKEQIFVCQRKESSTLSLLNLLLASARISPAGSSNNSLATSLCPVHDVLPEETTEYLQNMVLEIVTHKNHLKCQEFIRLLKSRSLNHFLRNCNAHSIDSALLKYKELKELGLESRKKSAYCCDTDITGDEILMEGLAIRCCLLFTLTKRSIGTSYFLDTMTKVLADLQKLQVNNMFTLLDKICQEAPANFSKVAEMTQHNFVLLISEVVFPSEDILMERYYDSSVYTEIVMGIKVLYFSLFRCLFWHTFETANLEIKFLSSHNKEILQFFVMEKFSYLKVSNFSGLDAIFPGPIKGSLITRYFELLKHFCSKRVVTLEETPVLMHSKHKEFTTMQELINDFHAINKEDSVPLQASEAYHSIYQCMELEISLLHSAERSKGHVTLSSEFGAALVVALLQTQYQEVCNETDPNNSLSLMAQGLHLRHFDGSGYKCEAPLLQCFLAYNLLTEPLVVTRNSAGLNDELEPLAFSSYARVCKYEALLDTFKEQCSHCINLLRLVLLHMKYDQLNDDVMMRLNQNFFLTTKLYYQKSLTSQIKELIGDQIYFQCISTRQNYSISASDEKWIVLFCLITLLDQKQWNLFAFVASKAIKEVDIISRRLNKDYHQTESLHFTLCQIPASKCVVFQYLDIVKSHVFSALCSKYNLILNKLPHLSESAQDGDQGSLFAQTEWLAKFWLMQKSGEFDALTVGEHDIAVPLTYPWQWFINAEGKEESNKLSCTVKEATSVLSEVFSSELEQILEEAKLTDQNKVIFLRYRILRVYWEQLYLKNMATTFEDSFISLNILKSLHTSTNIKNQCKDQLQKLAQLKAHKHNLTAKDTATAISNMTSLIMYMEKSVRAAKKSGMMSFDNFATFGDFFLHIPEAVVKEMVKKHKFEEEIFFLLCRTICEAQITEMTHEDDTLEKLRLDRQQWRLSANVVGADTRDSTATITGVLILDEHHIKKREAHITSLQKALMINLSNAQKQCTEQADYLRFIQNKVVDLLAHLIQVQMDEANGIIGKLDRMTPKSQKALYNEHRMALVQGWLDNIAAVLLGVDPVQNRLMSKTMRLNLQQAGHQLNEKLQRKKDSSIKARRSLMRIKRQASLSPYASEDDHGSTSSFLSALEEETQQEITQSSLPELSFQAQLKMMAEIEKEFQSEKMKILLQLEEQQNKMERKSPSRRISILTPSNVTEGSHQHLRDRAKSAGALRMKERMKERKKQKLAKMLDNDYGSGEDVQETTKDTSTDETITKLSQLEKTYEEKKKMLLSSIQ